MSLTDLPPELLDSIIEQTRPDGFEAIALTCKTTYAIAKEYIQEHNTLKRRYRDLSLRHEVAAISPRRLLLEILQNPLAGLYVESLTLTAPSSSPPTDGEVGSATPSASFMRLLRHSRYLHFTSEQADAWWTLIYAANTDDDGWRDANVYSTALLLFILPNIRKLALPDYWGLVPTPPKDSSEVQHPPGIWDVFDRLVEAANAGPVGTAPLGKLQTLLPYATIEYDSFPQNALMELQPFMEMNTLREIYATNCKAVDDGYTGIAFEWRNPEVSSNLRTLELAGCCIDGDGIAQLLPHTRLLTGLKYSHDTKWHGCQNDWDPAAFVQAVGEHLGSTLIDLAVTIDAMFGDIEHGVDSMKEFTALRTLELDVKVLCGPALQSGGKAGMDGSNGYSWEDDRTILPLAELVPSTIDIITLYADLSDGDESLLAIKKLFISPQFATVANAPHIVVRHGGEPGATTNGEDVERYHRLLNEAGQAVKTSGAEWLRAERPQARWRQAFEERFGNF